MNFFIKFIFSLCFYLLIFNVNLTLCSTYVIPICSNNIYHTCDLDHTYCDLSCTVAFDDVINIPLSPTSKKISYSVFSNDKNLSFDNYSNTTYFTNKYSKIPGILTFRGNSFRTSPSYGTISAHSSSLEKLWSFRTSYLNWGGGCGWTGQPLIIKWPNEIKSIMNLNDEFKNKNDFVEVICASLDGKVYFLDLDTGQQTRKPINTHNVIKGTPSLDPRGYPLLYVGQGLNTTGQIGYRIYNLITGELLYFINGSDKLAFRNWGAFDGSPLINGESDTLILGGENGILYILKLNTKFDIHNKIISVSPETIKYRYKSTDTFELGIENSVAAYKNLIYFADNTGTIQCVDLNSLQPVWSFFNTDDTDATLTLSIEDGFPYIYTGNEVDKQGSSGTCYLRKLDALTGDLIFEYPVHAYSIIGSNPINGGMLSTNIVGKNDIDNLCIFTIARYKNMNSGLIIALNKNTGKEVWRYEMPYYAWSSPVDIYDSNGKSYIIQCDSVGNMFLIEGSTGKILNKINLGSNIEGSPAVYKNTVILGTRGGLFYGINISTQ